jgi:hypothetical protein
MPKLVIFRLLRAGLVVLLAVGIGGAFLRPLSAQQVPTAAPSTAGVVNAVLRFRLHWLEDLTPMDLCSLDSHGREALLTAIEPELRGLVRGLTTKSCPRADQPETATRQVRLHSVVQYDTVATVRLFVQKGDHSHIEDYTVKRLVLLRPEAWDVADVRVWGRMYVVPPRNPRR